MNHQQNQKLRTCLWLVNTLRQHRQLTFDQIGQRWQSDTGISGGCTLPRSTFNDYRGYILDLFHIDIVCDRRTCRYSLESGPNPDLTDWLLSSFSITNLASQTQQVHDRIILEAPPRGMQHFDSVVAAFSSGCCLEGTYHKFGGETYTCHLRPYALKPYQSRWYLLAQKDEEPQIKCFGLDRFEQLRLLPDEPFTVPDGFDPHTYFSECIGVYHDDTLPVADVRICAHGKARHYLRLTPLHPSQREERIDDDTSHFVFRCQITPDLTLAILHHGQLVHVVSPASLRDAVHDELRAMIERYQGHGHGDRSVDPQNGLN